MAQSEIYAGFVSLRKLSKRLSARVRGLRRIYSGLLASGAAPGPQSFFADNFYTVIGAYGTRPLKKDSGMIPFDGRFILAEAIIDASGEHLADGDKVIMALRKACSKRRIYAAETEYIRFETVYLLIERICDCAKTFDPDIVRYMTLLSEIGGLDIVRINDLMNPVAIKLSEDRAYRESDPKTRLAYREAIYKTAIKTGTDELRLCDLRLEKYRVQNLDITSLSAIKRSRLGESAAVWHAAGIVLVSAAVSAVIAMLAGCPAAAVLLFLPATEAIRPLSDRILSHGRRPARLMRLSPDSEEVKSTRAVTVLSAQVADPDDVEALYERLLRLHCLDPADNITVCALIDLAAEQIPLTAEDRAVTEAISDMTDRLNREARGKFAGIVRKRSYSETQQEYMGRERKRGALMELAKFAVTKQGDFYAAFGNVDAVKNAEYFCAVDLDTCPQMDSVTELLSAALHPANRVEVKNGYVVGGYGIIAPRMVTGLKDSLSSEFSKSLGGIGSHSSYDGESANLYMDVFGLGTFCGKGLINVRALYECTQCLEGERILSHDILEGELLKTAYAGDIVFTEGFPKTPQSFYRRLDRWIRGDFQNIPEIFSRRFGPLSKLKLADNLRRAAIPPAVLTAAFAGFIFGPWVGGIIAGAALGLWLLPPAVGAISAFLRDRAPGRRFYSGLTSTASQSLRYILYSTVMLPTLAVKSAAAIFKALTRLITRRNLLEWTTSSSSDRFSKDPFAFYLLPELLSISLLWSPDYFIRLLGAVFSAMPALLGLSGAGASKKEGALKYRDGRELSKQTADMFSYFENYVTRADNWLPPDNVQFSPVYRVAHRTSPTNIGLYLLSLLAAYDRKLISRNALLDRLERTLSTVSRLEKYRGNLYNWYDTKTLELCPKPFVSSVDSGNFVVCLITLKEGLRELSGERARKLAERAEKLALDTELSVFYDGVRGLMSIGLDPATGKLSRSYYDCLMSEARLCSFWAIASRQVPKSHWQRMSRAMLSCQFFGGAASYSGTMFEYFMPEIFLKSPEGSLFGESLRYALWVQRKYAKSLGRPYGISESGYYSFDSALNYRYMAHGVPNAGIRRGLEQDYVVSPYSTYISLCLSGQEGMKNLRELERYGMYGSCGFYEALDWSSENGEGPEPVRSYMAHHIGMSICAADNILSGGIMQRRFMSDLRVKGAPELLEERFHLGTAVYENRLRRPRASEPEPRAEEIETIEEVLISEPRIKLLSGGGMTLAITDSGAVSAKYRSKYLCSRTRDPLTRPKGIFSFVSDGDEALPFGYLPTKLSGGTVEFTDEAAIFYRNTEKLSAGMKIRLREDLPCETRTFALKNETSEELEAFLASYIEPSLTDDASEAAHPAFGKMFLRCENLPEWSFAAVTRVKEERPVYLGIGFVEDIRTTVSFNREEVLDWPEGIYGLGKRFREIPPSLICEPDPCVFIRASVKLPPKSQCELNMFTVCADSKEELINRVSEIRRRRPRFSRSPRLDTASGRVASALLPDILYGLKMNESRREAIAENRLKLSGLWELSLSCELPTVYVALDGCGDRQKIPAYLGAYRLLRSCGIELQLIFGFDDGGRYEREHYTEIVAAARSMGLDGSVYAEGGILPLDISKTREGLNGLCMAASCHLCRGEMAPLSERKPQRKFLEIEPSEPVKQKVDFDVACGGFCGESYVINDKPPLPWCHVLSNRVFGTLMSNSSLGFSYAFNSRENRLTPWDNDPRRDNSGERLILYKNGRAFDLVKGAAAVFSPYKAEYFSRGEGYECRITVRVSETGMCKRLDVDIKTDSEAKICYYTEPCLGPDRYHSALITPKRREKGIILCSAASEAGGYMYIGASESCGATTLREDVFCGELSENAAVNADPAAAVFFDISGKKSLSFYLSYGLTERSAEKMPELFKMQTDTREKRADIATGDPAEELLANVWLRYQALHARIYARTGFYQCSGAYGFRDQLQDACGIAEENPNALKTQILRSCCAQFPEGDVMHWWHSLPNLKKRGIRTKISDDALWLPYALCEYLRVTGDESILSLKAPFCEGQTLSENESERYGEVYKTAARETVYTHCRRAIDSRLGKTGRHGLMLIGGGDWNDGFGAVGAGGEGESVWLSEFYITVLRRFANVAEKTGDLLYAETLRENADGLEKAVEENGRDQNWYLRGYFDGGEPLGSAKCRECRIDSIAQSFAEFCGLGRDGFAEQSLKNAYSELADIKRGVVKLFSPAFSDDAEPDPGYVKSYPEGMRENGGQYTHGAVWLALACLEAGLKDEGEEILKALNPIKRSQEGGWKRYKTEPYYLCGDVYANKNCFGRGGWSIYTGAAGWLYRALRYLHDEDGKRTGF